MTGFGLGWVNVAADYSRYLPRAASAAAGWSAGRRSAASLAPVVLLVFGLLLAGSSHRPVRRDRRRPGRGARRRKLPTWFLVPFAVVAVLGLVGGAVLDIYSSGLALLTLGLRVPRWSAALVDGVIMVLGTIYVVFFADDFLGPFQGFLYHARGAGRRLGRGDAGRRGAAPPRLRRAPSSTTRRPLRRRPAGRPWRWSLVGTVLGLGPGDRTRTPTCLTWQGYLLGPFGLGGRDGAWAYANLGVLVALAVGFVGTLSSSSGSRQRAAPTVEPR